MYMFNYHAKGSLLNTKQKYIVRNVTFSHNSGVQDISEGQTGFVAEL